jgi:hypothetical protein
MSIQDYDDQFLDVSEFEQVFDVINDEVVIEVSIN